MSPAPAPLPVKLELPLCDVPLNTQLACSLLHELVKFVLFARGQVHAPYDNIRSAVKVSAPCALRRRGNKTRKDHQHCALRRSGL